MLDETTLNSLFEPGSAFYAPSDQLPELMETHSKLSLVKSSQRPSRKRRVVVDANVILRNLRWMALKRQNANARTGLFEAIDSGIIEVYAPKFMQEEVMEYLKVISADDKLDYKYMAANWRAIKRKIKFRTPKEELVSKYTRPGDDIKDAPYLALAEKMGGIRIVSSDTDIQRMGGYTLDPLTITPLLRETARSMAVWLQCKINVHLIAIAGTVITVGLIKMIAKLIVRMPGRLKLISLILIGLTIWAFWKKIKSSDKAQSFIRDVWDIMMEIGIRLLERKEIAQRHLALVDAQIDSASASSQNNMG